MFDPSDVLLRLVDVWYDVLWSWQMRSTRKASSASAPAPASLVQRMKALDDRLRTVRRAMKREQFESICDVALNNDDDLYPGLGDVLEMAHALTGASGTTFVEVFETLFFALCDFLVGNDRDAVTCKKMLLTPRKTTQPSYDLCRRTFCDVLAERADVVERGLAAMRPVPTEAVEEIEERKVLSKEEETRDANPTPRSEPAARLPFPMLGLSSESESESENSDSDADSS